MRRGVRIIINNIKNKITLLINDDKFKSILLGSVYSFSAKVASMLLGIITSIIGARYYGAEVIGNVAIVSSILGMGAIVSIFGLSTAMLTIIPKYTVNVLTDIGLRIYKKTLLLMLISSAVVSFIIFQSSSFLAVDVFNNNGLILFITLSSFIVVFRAIYDLNLNMMRNLNKNKQYSIFIVLPKILTLVILLVMTILFYDKDNLLYIVFSIPVIMTVISSYYLYLHFNKNIDDKEFNILPTNKDIVITAFPMLITNTMMFSISQVDIIMLGIFESPKNIGIYSIVLSLSLFLTFIFSSINLMAGPKFSELFYAKKNDELKYVAKKSTKLTFFMALPIITILIVLGNPILSVYGSEYAIGYSALLLILIGQFVGSVVGPVEYFLNMTGHQKQFRNIMIFAGVINIILNYFFIPIYGINGAALGTMISIISYRVLASLYIKRVFGFFIMYIPSRA